MVVKRIRSVLCLCHAQAHLRYFKFVCFDDCRRFGCMVSFFRPHFLVCERRQLTWSLAFFWCVGLLAGAAVAASTDISRFNTMRTAVFSCVSISGLVVCLLLPLLFSALAVYISQIRLLVPIAFCKAFLFSFLSTAMWRLYPTSGWMLRQLLLFSDCLAAPVLLWLWIRLSLAPNRFAGRNIMAACVLMAVIGCLDLHFISPFLADLQLH